ncbi:MAG: hypothetical protein LBG58_01340 [Planctomycetaceae bacterium]|jgi:hypothetical protein|nr:hypothetical protein [Planctomycetaceae bacterium]
MKTISELAYDAIIALNLIPAENVGINAVISADWNGETRIIVSESESEQEGHQLGAIAQTTVLTIYVLSRNHNTALNFCLTAGKAVYKAIEKLERKQGYGILAITRYQNGIKNVTDRTEFEAFRSFNVINKINF